MKILGLTQKNSGCGFHRVILPLAFMDDITAHVTNHPTEEVMAEKWDILLFNRISIFDDKFEVLKSNGYKIVLDMDDDWILPSNHVNFHDYQRLAPRIESNIKQADLVTCTNQRLYNRLKEFNSNVKIFPNALPYGEHQFTQTKQESEKVRIFWCGSVTHEPDLEILRNPFQRLLVHKDKIEMVIGGYNDANPYSKYIWFKMWQHYTLSNKLPNQLLKGLEPTEYMKLYEQADICVIPLENSEWHSAKSNLKILEAASKKIPVVVSCVEPYSIDTDAPVFWVKSQSDWFKHLNKLILNPELRKDYGEKIYQWAKDKYNFADINTRRRSAFTDLIKA